MNAIPTSTWEGMEQNVDKMKVIALQCANGTFSEKMFKTKNIPDIIFYKKGL